MMAGTGVSSGGGGMLRARRRDVSVKPNRKLDRKSSRGMIYENEELRLRTIHINAEVEQGQNDIKKLRKENEQLRHEIWSLRDEYDKLEDILKRQKNREDSEDNEDRSEEETKDDDDDPENDSDYSVENDDVDDDDENRDENEENVDVTDGHVDHERDHEERLENAENQKISSEKMNNSLHRLHVEFDDLSVVDEEEELKREKDRKDVVTSEDNNVEKMSKNKVPIGIDVANGYPCFPSQYSSSSGTNYYSDCPFTAIPGYSDILPYNPSPMVLTPCPTSYDAAMTSSGYDETFRDNRVAYNGSIGWRGNIYEPEATFNIAESYRAGVMAAKTSGICSPGSTFTLSGQSDRSAATTASTLRLNSVTRGTPVDDVIPTARSVGTNENDLSMLFQRMNFGSKPANGSHDEAPGSAEVLTRNGWDFSRSGNTSASDNDQRSKTDVQKDRRRIEEIREQRDVQTDRPKHFFAPLHPTNHHGRLDSNDRTMMRGFVPTNDSGMTTCAENFDTGRSSSSDRTVSTVVSNQNFRDNSSASGTGTFSETGGKGSADICVNGVVSARDNENSHWLVDDPKTRKSFQNLSMDNNNHDTSRGNSSSGQGSNNPLVKSISCQDLTSEQLHNSLFEISRTFCGDAMSQKLTKSENTLDNPSSGSPKPFKSQLNVTLKLPSVRRDSPDTPEIPKLPSIDCRLFGNRFVKTFHPNSVNHANYGNRNPFAGPLSMQTNENGRGKLMNENSAMDYSNPMLTHSFARRLNPEEMTENLEPRTFVTEMESERDRTSCQNKDSRVVSGSKSRPDFQVTSFEQPNPRNLMTGLSPFDLNPLRRLPANDCANSIIGNHQKLYQNVPFVAGNGTAVFCSPEQQTAMRMFIDNQTLKVPAQTQTSIDGESDRADDARDEAVKDSKNDDTEDPGNETASTSIRQKRSVRKIRNDQKTDKRPLSPAAQRRKLRKQSSVNSTESGEAGGKRGANKARKLSVATTTTTTTASEHAEDKNESRSSSSGQESPKKDGNRRISVYFNSKKRPSVGSVKMARSGSVDNTKDGFATRIGDQLDTTNSERERTNSASSREVGTRKNRKSSVSSGKVPWCACWGNGCV